MGDIAALPEKNCILVVDDASDTLEVLQRNLQTEGYRVFVAPAVPEAIRIVDENQVDLVITDLKMPKVSGLDLVRHVRENCKDTAVMMRSSAMPRLAERSKQSRAGQRSICLSLSQMKSSLPPYGVRLTDYRCAGLHRPSLNGQHELLMASLVNLRHYAMSLGR